MKVALANFIFLSEVFGLPQAYIIERFAWLVGVYLLFSQPHLRKTGYHGSLSWLLVLVLGWTRTERFYLGFFVPWLQPLSDMAVGQDPGTPVNLHTSRKTTAQWGVCFISTLLTSDMGVTPNSSVWEKTWKSEKETKPCGFSWLLAFWTTYIATSSRRGRRALSLSDVNDLCSTLFRVALSSGMGHKEASTDEAGKPFFRL